MRPTSPVSLQRIPGEMAKTEGLRFDAVKDYIEAPLTLEYKFCIRPFLLLSTKV